MNLSPKQKKQLKRVADALAFEEKGAVSLLELVFALEDKLDTEIPEIKALIDKVKSETLSKDEVQRMIDLVVSSIEIPKVVHGERGEKGEKGEKGDRGLDGRNGVDGKQGPAGLNGINGRDADEGVVAEKVETNLIKNLPKFGKQFRDGLELLPKGERLNINFIDGIDDYSEVARLAKASQFLNRGGNGKGLLSQLNDVNIQSPSNNQVLKYNSTSKLWENNTDSSTVNTDATLTGDGSISSPLGINLSNSNAWLAPQYFYDSLSNLTLDTDLKQMWSSSVLMFDWSANTFKPNEDIAFPNEFDVFQFGSDPSTTKSGLPLRFIWEGTGGGSGWLKFDDGAGNLQVLRSNIEADSIAVSSIAGSSASFSSVSGTTITSSSISNKQVVFSNSGVLTGDIGYEYDSTNNRLLLSNASITAQNQLHLHQSGATSLGIQLTNSATGSASSNGSLISVTSAGVLDINQRANQVMNFYTNNTIGMTINTSQQVLITGGTVSAPSLAIGGDTDTGIYRWNATANHLGFAAGGAVGLIVGHSNGTPYVSVSSDATRIGNLVKFNVGGTGSGGDAPLIGIKNTSETTTGKNGGIFTQTRMTSRYLQTSQNIGFNDNSFGNPGVIQWTGWEYSDNTYTTLVTPTEFTGWSYQYYNGSAYKNLLRIHTSGVYVNALNAAAVPAARLHVNSTNVAAGTPGTEDAFVIGRALNSNVSYEQVATFAIGTYSTNSIANSYGPDTRLDLKLKASSSDNFTANVTVMTWLDTGAVGVGETAPSALLDIKASTTALPHLRLRAGVAPTTPNDGDVWYENTNDRLMFRKNTTTSEIVSASAVTTEALTSDTTLTIAYNGVTYKLLAKA